MLITAGAPPARSHPIRADCDPDISEGRHRKTSMVGIVKLALRRPYTFIVMALLIMIFGVASALRTPTDIFPVINIPLVSVVFSHTGLPLSQEAGCTPPQRASRAGAAIPLPYGGKDPQVQADLNQPPLHTYVIS